MKRRELMLLLGGMMTVARTLRAQQKPMPVIGLLSSVSADSGTFRLTAFRQGQIGIGGHLAVPPLPHHRAYGSRTRRFDWGKLGQEHELVPSKPGVQVLASPRPIRPLGNR